MNAALEEGGVAVGVLADSLVRAVRDGDVRRAIADERLCFITPYKPTAGFSVASAMGRNKLIYALSQATLVVAADVETGGTWEGAVESLRKEYAPVLVWTGAGAGPGNEALVRRGATGAGDVGTLFPLPRAERASGSSLTQLSLDV
jgi:predicted Rossmann fold nucleotide-binding protein DprA/Smf involved in DNA uptake